MATFKIFREFSLPNALEPYAVYLIASSDYPNHLEFYVSDSTGTSLRRLPTMTEIHNIIDNAFISNEVTKLEIVEDITARNQITNLQFNTYALVLDASADPEVTAGAATYMWQAETDTWHLITKAESLDLNWDEIVGKPTSTAEEIDDAVTLAHTHNNKTVVDNLTANGFDQLLYSGTLPYSRWQLIQW